MLFGGFFFGFVLSIAAIVIAAWALAIASGRSAARSAEQRLAALEEQVRGLLYRVWTLERSASPAAPPFPEQGPAHEAPAVMPVSSVVPPPAEPVAAVAPAAPIAALVPEPPPPPAPQVPRLDLEQRIGARWATWVGVVAILFAVAFFLKWSFDNDLLGPGTRVVLGLVTGLGLLMSGLGTHRHRELPYLSEGLSGLGLGMLYLSFYGAHALYGLLGLAAAFASMSVVTLLGALVAVVSSRQITAVLSLLGGLLTPVLLMVERPDERNLLAYLLVLDLLVLAIARFRTWPGLNRLAWAGTALLFAPTLLREPESPHPLSRLVLLSALFVLFLAVPLFREWAQRRRHAEIDLALVVANAAGYFWAVYVTLEPWHPGAEGPWALALAVVYRVVSADYVTRVPEDEATTIVHEGIAWTFLTLAIPLALSGRWVTLAWAAQGVMLLRAASRIRTPVAAWGGVAALLLAGARVLVVDRYWYPETVPVWNGTYLVHLLVVVALAWGGNLAAAARVEALRGLPREAFRSLLWIASAFILAVLLWREPPGLWPATLLMAELLLLGWLARASSSPAFLIATPVVAAVLLVRVLWADDLAARIAAESLLNQPLLSRVAACAALAVAGSLLARSGASARAPALGRLLSGAAGIVLLFVLSVNWTRFQDFALREARDLRRWNLAGEIRWKTQVGLSVLWTLYAAAALGWGFIRSRAAVRYAALALFGLTVFKVFLVDLAAVRTVYRILSFLVLGVVLLGVSLLYQKARRPLG